MTARILCGALAIGLISAVLVSGSRSMPAAQDERKPSPNSKANITIRYADACLRLAEAELKQIEEANAKVPDLMPWHLLERAKMNVVVARQQLDLAKKYEHGSTMPMQQAFAQANARLAQVELQAALATQKREPDAVTDTEIERLKARKEVFVLRTELWQDPTYVPSLLDQMQWQIDRLSEQVIEQNNRLRSLEILSD